MATGINNKGGRAVEVNIIAEDSDGPCLFLQIEDSMTAREVANVFFTRQIDVDEFLSDVTAAARTFKALLAEGP